jgi:predicted MFS family arabinose efflux permease
MSTTAAPKPASTARNRSRTPFLLGGLAALLCAQMLYGVLVLSALHKQYAKPMLAVQALVCDKLGSRLGIMTRLGKTPERMAHLDRILAPYADAAPDALLVLGTGGRVLEGWGRPRGSVFRLPAKPDALHGETAEFSMDGSIWLVSALKDREERVVGHVVLGMDEARRSEQVWQVLRDNIRLLGGITAGAALLLVILALTVRTTTSPGKAFPKKRVYASLVLPLVAGQLLFAAAMLEPLRDMNESHLDAVARQLGRHVGSELEHLLGLGLGLDQLPPVAGHLAGLQRFLPETLGLGILGAAGARLHAADARGGLDDEAWRRAEAGALSTDVPFRGGTVRVLMSAEAVAANIRAITLDTLTMTVVAILFLMELVNLLVMREDRRAQASPEPLSSSPGFMRPVIFVCMFAIDMSLSFVPLRLGELSPNLLGLPADMVMSLPVSFEMFMVGLAIMLGGFWSERSGWRALLLTGVSLVTLGNLASGLSEDPFLYIASRGLAGSGYGLLNLSAQLFVLAHSRPDRRAGNLATVFAGLFAGALCGSASGGLIADRLGYSGAFLVASALMLLTGVVLWRAMPRERAPRRTAETPSRPAPGLGGTLAFITDPRMAALLFLNIVPGAFVTVCLFQFFVPVSLNQGGASPADIGRVTMIFPLVIVYLGPLFGGLVDRSKRKYLHLTLAGLIAAASVGALFALEGIAAATLAVTLLGLSNAILSNAQGAYALELPATERYGAARAMGIYNVTERIGQVMGPVSLGAVIAIWGRNAGLGVMAAGLAAVSLLFAAANLRKTRN